MYIWHLKGVTKSNNDLVVTLKGINSLLPIPDWAFPKALNELEKCGMIKTLRQRGKSSAVTILCENCYEGYPTLNFDHGDRLKVHW